MGFELDPSPLLQVRSPFASTPPRGSREYRKVRLGLRLGLALCVTYLGFALPMQGQSGSSAVAAWDLHPGVARAVQAVRQGHSAPQRPPLQKNLTMVAFTDLGSPLCNPACASDVWAHGNYAYVGTHIDFSGSRIGVRVIDLSDPSNPQVVNNLPAPEAFTRTADVMVVRVDTEFFHGDLLATSNELAPGAFVPTFFPPNITGGFQLWDVTDPLHPIELSAPRIGPTHNLHLFQRGTRAFVLAVLPLAELLAGLFPPFVPFGDLVIVEVTDPRNPVVLTDWGAGKDAGLTYGLPFPLFGAPVTCDPSVCRGAAPAVFLHDVWVNQQGTIAYLPYWDLGLVLLDISDPANPKFLGLGSEPPSFGGIEGNMHSAVPALGGNLVVVGDEAVRVSIFGVPFPLPWGFLRIFDTSDASNPVQVGAYATFGALNETDTAIPSDMHNIFVRGSRAYLSWQFEGIRVVDFSQPSNPREVAAFIPPAGTSPGFFYGVYVHRDLILGSDILGGFYVLKQVP